MKKITKITTILLVVFMFFVFSISAEGYTSSTGYSYSDDYITTEGQNKTKLEAGKSVWLIQGDEAVYQANSGRYQTSALHQPNIWCVEHGQSLSYGKFKVTKKYEVTDLALWYILNEKAGETSLQTNHKDAAQVALWMYMTDGLESDNKNEIKRFSEIRLHVMNQAAIVPTIIMMEKRSIIMLLSMQIHMRQFTQMLV